MKPDNLEGRREFKEVKHGKQEEEVSLLDIDPEKFMLELEKRGAQIEHPKRLLDDLRWSPKKDQQGKAVKILSPDFSVLKSQDAFAQEEFKASLTLLQTQDPKITVRLRHDGDKLLFTVKGRPNKTEQVKSRQEFEVEITQAGYDQLNKYFESTHNFKSRIQAERTTLVLSVDGHEVKVEIETFPQNIPSRAEIEGDKQSIQAAVEYLRNQEIFYGGTSTLGKTEILRQYLGQSAREPLILTFE